MITPQMLEPASCGRPSAWTMREIQNAVFYALCDGRSRRTCLCAAPRSATSLTEAPREFGRINRHLVMADRERDGREASPTAAVLDSQSVKATESGGPRNYDAARTIEGCKRQAPVDTDGRALVPDPQAADVQDHDWAEPMLPCRDGLSR